STGGPCTFDNDEVTCTIVSLGPGQSATVAITNATTPGTRGQRTHEACGTDDEATGDCDQETVTFSVLPALDVTKTAADTTPTAGEPLTYTVVVSNSGPSSVSCVLITDSMPFPYTTLFRSSTGGPCTFDNDEVTCTIVSLGPGQSA